jgi:hypothetical protein
MPEFGDPLAGGGRPGAQLGELLADLPLVAAQLPRELAGAQPLAAANLADPVVALHRGGQPLGVGGGAAGDGGLLVAAGGEVRLQPSKLLGGGAAVADGLGQHPAVSLLVAQRSKPLPGDGRGGADLARQRRGIKPLVAMQLSPEVGVSDSIPHQPHAQLPQPRITFPLDAQQPQQVTRETRRHAHLAGQLHGVDRLA